jgi:hypothetical protein
MGETRQGLQPRFVYLWLSISLQVHQQQSRLTEPLGSLSPPLAYG